MFPVEKIKTTCCPNMKTRVWILRIHVNIRQAWRPLVVLGLRRQTQRHVASKTNQNW